MLILNENQGACRCVWGERENTTHHGFRNEFFNFFKKKKKKKKKRERDKKNTRVSEWV